MSMALSLTAVVSETKRPLMVNVKTSSGTRRPRDLCPCMNFFGGRIFPRAVPDMSATRHSTSLILLSVMNSSNVERAMIIHELLIQAIVARLLDQAKGGQLKLLAWLNQLMPRPIIKQPRIFISNVKALKERFPLMSASLAQAIRDFQRPLSWRMQATRLLCLKRNRSDTEPRGE